ncbi:hypothetical protein CHS0354_015300, partial [Potamilus streckersoni]
LYINIIGMEKYFLVIMLMRVAYAIAQSYFIPRYFQGHHGFHVPYATYIPYGYPVVYDSDA